MSLLILFAQARHLWSKFFIKTHYTFCHKLHLRNYILRYDMELVYDFLLKLIDFFIETIYPKSSFFFQPLIIVIQSLNIVFFDIIPVLDFNNLKRNNPWVF